MDQTDLLPRSCVSFVKLYLTLILWSSCKMNKVLLSSLAIGGLAMCLPADAAVVTIEALDVRSTGVFGHDPNVVFTLDGGPGDPTGANITYSNLDLDGDASANDSVTFTIAFTSSTGNQRLFNQGADTGFGNLTDLTVSVTGVSGTTTDLGHTIVFDGFTGANAASGSGAAIDRFVEINGTLVTLSFPSTGGFQFQQNPIDFALTPTVLYDNSGGTIGSLVARHHDLQFSTVVPEPASALLLGAGALLIARRRR